VKIILYDNTLRDGEQTPGVCFSAKDKIAIARGLARAGFPALEAGFAAVSMEERHAIRDLARLELGPRIFSLARLDFNDIQAARHAGVDGITLLAPASDNLLRIRPRFSVRMLPSEIAKMVAYAKQRKLSVRFSCEDATRTPLARLLVFYRAAWEAGADCLGYADTAGIATPERISRRVRAIKRALPLPLSIHCHNDLGLAVANSLAAARAGADEIHVTLNGLGERAGNTPAEEFILAMKAAYGQDLGIDLAALMELSRELIRITGLEPGFNKPVIGRNVFRHEAGMHVQGLLRPECGTYEPYPPAWVGRSHEVAFGKHSGRSNIRFLCRKQGLVLAPSGEERVLARIKQLAQMQQREISTEEVLQWIYLSQWEQTRPKEPRRFHGLNSACVAGTIFDP
jgi:isopropylmalate/homocitrate/citramalate synthase